MKFLKKQNVDTAEVQQDIFTGNGQNTEFILTFTVINVKQLFVSIDGLTQEPQTAYSVSLDGTKIVFSEAPPNTSKILCKYVEAAPLNVTEISDNSVSIAKLATADGSAGQALTTTGSGVLQFRSVKSADIEYKNTDFTAVPGQSVQVDTSVQAVTLTLPSSPVQNDSIQIVDGGGTFDTRNLTIARNGKTIMGHAEDLVVNYNLASFGLVYNGTTWRIFG